MPNIGGQAVSGAAWRERFGHFAKFAIIGKGGFKMNGCFTKEYSSIDELLEDMGPGDQVVTLPISVAARGASHV